MRVTQQRAVFLVRDGEYLFLVATFAVPQPARNRLKQLYHVIYRQKGGYVKNTVIYTLKIFVIFTHPEPVDDLIHIETCSSEKSVKYNLVSFGQFIIIFNVPLQNRNGVAQVNIKAFKFLRNLKIILMLRYY